MVNLILWFVVEVFGLWSCVENEYLSAFFLVGLGFMIGKLCYCDVWKREKRLVVE